MKRASKATMGNKSVETVGSYQNLIFKGVGSISPFPPNNVDFSIY